MKATIVGIFCIFTAAAAFAQSPKTSKNWEPTPSMRKEMAAMHEKMAKCLRSTKPFSECRHQMMKEFPHKDWSGCPGMGHGHMMHGHGRMWNSKSSK